MSFELPARYRQLREQALTVASSVADRAAIADDSLTADPIMRKALTESGLVGLTVPRAYGGTDEKVDPLAMTVVREALMGTSAHLDGLFGMQGIGSLALSVAGHEQIKRTWLPRVARLDAIAALALTEPDVGSDLRSVTTSITQRPDSSVVVNGHKSFITNAGDAAIYSVLGREGDGYSMVLVPATPRACTSRADRA